MTSARAGSGRWIAVAAAELVIVIHVVLTPMHLMETLYIGVLFTVGNCLLFAAVLLLAGRRHQPAGWLLGAAVCGGELLGFCLSRTTGLPMGYHESWVSSPEDYLGLASLGCELTFLLLFTSAAARMRAPAAPVDDTG